jgi:hypothetical protein
MTPHSLRSPADLRSAESSLASLARTPLTVRRRSRWWRFAPSGRPPAHRSLLSRPPCGRPRGSRVVVPAGQSSRSPIRRRSLARGSLRSPLAHPAASLRSAARVAPPGSRVVGRAAPSSRSLSPRPHFVRPRGSRLTAFAGCFHSPLTPSSGSPARGSHLTFRFEETHRVRLLATRRGPWPGTAGHGIGKRRGE